MSERELAIKFFFIQSDNPDLTISEIVDATGAHYSKVYNVLDKFRDLGIVKVEYGANANYYSATPEGKEVGKQIRAMFEMLSLFDADDGLSDIPF